MFSFGNKILQKHLTFSKENYIIKLSSHKRTYKYCLECIILKNRGGAGDYVDKADFEFGYSKLHDTLEKDVRKLNKYEIDWAAEDKHQKMVRNKKNTPAQSLP